MHKCVYVRVMCVCTCVRVRVFGRVVVGVCVGGGGLSACVWGSRNETTIQRPASRKLLRQSLPFTATPPNAQKQHVHVPISYPHPHLPTCSFPLLFFRAAAKASAFFCFCLAACRIISRTLSPMVWLVACESPRVCVRRKGAGNICEDNAAT